MLNDRSKSILLQVAYKGVVEGGVGTAPTLKDAVLEQYNLLVGLHEELGLSPDDTASAPRRGGGASRRTENVSKAAEPNAPIINIGGVDYLDFRGQKELGAQKPGYPDFKLASNPNARNASKWLLFNGEPTEFAIENGLA